MKETAGPEVGDPCSAPAAALLWPRPLPTQPLGAPARLPGLWASCSALGAGFLLRVAGKQTRGLQRGAHAAPQGTRTSSANTPELAPCASPRRLFWVLCSGKRLQGAGSSQVKKDLPGGGTGAGAKAGMRGRAQYRG